MFLIFKLLCVVSVMQVAKCTSDGISYLSDKNRIEDKFKRGEDPCNPLYWYPRMIPDECGNKIEVPSRPKLIPLPVPVPAPPPPPNPFIPIPMPMPPQIFMPPPMPFPMPGPSCPMPAPGCSMPLPAYSMPQLPAPMPAPMPYPYPYPYPYFSPPQPMMGMVPGIPGMVSRDGAINIMPMSDVYADVLEKHKQRMVRKRLESVLNEYEGKNQDGRKSKRHAWLKRNWSQ